MGLCTLPAPCCRFSTKVLALVQELELLKVASPGAKSLVFTCFTNTLQATLQELRSRGYTVFFITGACTRRQREAAVKVGAAQHACAAWQAQRCSMKAWLVATWWPPAFLLASSCASTSQPLNQTCSRPSAVGTRWFWLLNPRMLPSQHTCMCSSLT